MLDSDSITEKGSSSIQGKRILVLDSSPEVRELIERSLKGAGAEVVQAGDSAEGLRHFRSHKPDLAIIDVTLPESQGWEACRLIREISQVPILMLVGQSQVHDIQQGIDCGANDFLRKPFGLKLLLVRAGRLLGHLGPSSEQVSPLLYDDGYLTVKLGSHRVIVNGEPVKLTPKEHRLLKFLIRHAGRVCTFEQILNNVWGWAQKENDAYIHVHISNLRRKLERDPKNPEYLITEHRLGYLFAKQTDLQKA